MRGDAATPETRALALAMFESHVPCFFSTVEPFCSKEAAWIAYFVHQSGKDCGGAHPFPVCSDHRQMMEHTTHPFWRAWFNSDPVLCDGCGAEITIDRFEAIT
ncbi:hypothetical protein [Streptomyces chartreusis]